MARGQAGAEAEAADAEAAPDVEAAESEAGSDAEAAEAAAVVGTLADNGMLTVPAAENVVRVLPPLIVEERHIDEAMTIFDTTFAGLAS